MSTTTRTQLIIAISAIAVLTLGGSVVAQSAQAASAGPYGLTSMAQLDQLPYLDPEATSGMDSSYQRNGGYDDWNGALYGRTVTGGAEQIYTDQGGPGEITRIWGTRLESDDWIRVYFDGESTPRINVLASAFFSGTQAPFRGPLVMPDTVSSGGFVSYLPLPFAGSVKVALYQPNSSQQTAYLQVNYRLFSPGTPVTTWTSSETGTQDSTAVRGIWNNAGSDPKPAAADTTLTGTANLGSGATATLANVTGPRSVSGIRIKLPEITGRSTQITDGGRAYAAPGGVASTSQFVMAINPSNSGVRLQRRLDYEVGDQKANVYVDGVLIAQWFDQGRMNPVPGGRDVYYAAFKNTTFDIPSTATAGKSSITVKIEFVSSAYDWNEFAYWAFSKVGGTYTQTDFLDVGPSSAELASQSAHSYTEAGPHGTFTRTFYYDPDAAVRDALNELQLRIYWDGSSTPSVDTTLGMFFGIGEYGYSLAPKSLMMGIDDSNYLYAYWPMPFASNARITLTNTGGGTRNGIQYSVSHRAFSGSFDNVGYFTTEYRQQAVAGGYGTDATLLEKDGSGAVVGMVLSSKGLPDTSPVHFVMPGYPDLDVPPGFASWVEGDEHVYIDGSQTPVYHGTGIEDSANGGFGWQYGYLALPSHGMSYAKVDYVPGSKYQDSVSYSRLMLEDRISFRSHISYRLEHGFTNNIGIADLTTLLYYYFKPTLRTTPADVLELGDGASESAHSLSTSGTATSPVKQQSFAGDYRDAYLTDAGKTATGWLQFTSALGSANAGMVIRNRFDQSVAAVDADVYVDGSKVGTWHAIGGNSDTAWAESDFTVPASFTSGKSSVTIRLVNLAGTPFNSYRLSTFTIRSGPGASLPAAPGATVNLSNADFESGDLTGWMVLSGTEFSNARVTTQTVQNGVSFQQHGSYHPFGFGNGAGDGPTGSMRTPDFLLGGDGKVDFLVSGGRSLSGESVSLVRSDGLVLFTATGKEWEAYSRVVFDARDYVGSTAYLLVTDTGTGGWGHVNIDDIHVAKSAFATNVIGSWKSLSGVWTDTSTGLVGDAAPGADVLRLSSQAITNGTVEADITLTGSSGAGAVIARANTAGTQFYAANVDYSQQRVTLWGPGVSGATASLPISLNTAYHVKLSLIGSTLRVYVNTYGGGTSPIITLTDTTYGSGLVGLNVWNGAARFQNLTVS